MVGLKKMKSLKFFKFWAKKNWKYNQKLEIPVNSVIFLKFGNLLKM